MSDEKSKENQLDLVMQRFSSTLAELGQTCIDLQKINHIESDELKSAEIVTAQALDRVTQSLECLSAFSAALASNSSLRSISVSDREYDAIKLASIRQLIATSGASAGEDDIELFA